MIEDALISSFAVATVGYATRRYLDRSRPHVLDPSLFPGQVRVALFSGNYNCVRDGANQALNRLVRYLGEGEGIAVRVYSPVAPRPAFAPFGDLVPVPSLAIPGRSEYRLAMGLPAAVRADLARFRPTVIHLSAPDGLGLAALRMARANGIPAVSSMHTRFETYFDYYGLGLARPFGELWLRRFYGGCDRILVPTSATRAAMADWGLGERCRTWSRGVDRRRFSPARRDMAWRRSRGFGDDDVVPLFFGRLVHEKGLKAFAGTIAILRRRGIRVRPLVVGEGPAKRWFADNLPDALFAGHMDGDDLGKVVASADLLINPSLTEAFGNVTLEGMAAGLPIICPDVGSTHDLVEDGISGFVVPARPDAYADAAEYLALTPHLRREMGRAARRASARFDWDEANRAVYEVYCDVLSVEPARMPAMPLSSYG